MSRSELHMNSHSLDTLPLSKKKILRRGLLAGAAAFPLALALALVALPAGAHHSGSMFEKEKTVTLKGVVKEFQYTNPHSWLIVTVVDAKGTPVDWGFEAEGPSTLLRAGIKRSDFSPGTKITITGRPMRDGRPAAFWLKAVRDDGKVFMPAQGFATK